MKLCLESKVGRMEVEGDARELVAFIHAIETAAEIAHSAGRSDPPADNKELNGTLRKCTACGKKRDTTEFDAFGGKLRQVCRECRGA